MPTDRRARRAELLDAAVGVFRQRGYDGSTIRDIAEAMGIPDGSVYGYIAAKDDLLAALCDEVHAAIDGILADVRAVPGVGPIERLSRYVHDQAAYNLDHVERIAVYYHEATRAAAHRPQILRRWQPHLQFATEEIRAAQRRGLTDARADERVLAFCAFGVFVSVYRWYDGRGGAAGRARLAAGCARYAVNALLTPGAPRTPSHARAYPGPTAGTRSPRSTPRARTGRCG